MKVQSTTEILSKKQKIINQWTDSTVDRLFKNAYFLKFPIKIKKINFKVKYVHTVQWHNHFLPNNLCELSFNESKALNFLRQVHFLPAFRIDFVSITHRKFLKTLCAAFWSSCLYSIYGTALTMQYDRRFILFVCRLAAFSNRNRKLTVINFSHKLAQRENATKFWQIEVALIILCHRKSRDVYNVWL